MSRRNLFLTIAAFALTAATTLAGDKPNAKKAGCCGYGICACPSCACFGKTCSDCVCCDDGSCCASGCCDTKAAKSTPKPKTASCCDAKAKAKAMTPAVKAVLSVL